MRYADGGGLTVAGRAKREAVRFEAAEMFERGVRPPEMARRLRVSRKSAYAWHAAWLAVAVLFEGVQAWRRQGDAPPRAPAGPGRRRSASCNEAAPS
ncbi:helix-turn-helix domain-containing protein [Streptomyces sp. NPDC046931]|uniref:helix-turn-helix domain-containing protein n=1 Tax=Streptomyces sp. NPDC046931 TaxID=3154806 RepID=UPI0033DBF289